MDKKEIEASSHVKKHSQIFKIYCELGSQLLSNDLWDNQPENSIPIQLKTCTSVFSLTSENYSACFEKTNFKNIQFGSVSFFPDDQSVYLGQFLADEKNGFGLLMFEDGSFYEGQFRNDVASGSGKIVFSNGNIFEGEIENFMPNGLGKFILSNGDSVFANFKNTEIVGKAKVVFLDGSCYEGALKNFSKEGEGVFQDFHGNRYEGTFKNDVFWGTGKLFLSDKKSYIMGTWKNHILLDGAQVHYEDGSMYIGQLQNLKRNGWGEYTANGLKFTGNWKDDNKIGIFSVFSIHDDIVKNVTFTKNTTSTENNINEMIVNPNIIRKNRTSKNNKKDIEKINGLIGGQNDIKIPETKNCFFCF